MRIGNLNLCQPVGKCETFFKNIFRKSFYFLFFLAYNANFVGCGRGGSAYYCCVMEIGARSGGAYYCHAKGSGAYYCCAIGISLLDCCPC